MIVVILILVLWLAILAIIIKLDVGGLGTILRPTLKDVPIINTLLPKLTEEELAVEKNYPFYTLSGAMDYIHDLEDYIKLLEDENARLSEANADLEKEVARLKFFEDDVLNFEARKKRFDFEVVFSDKSPPLDVFYDFYREMNPDTAEQIFELIARAKVYTDAIREEAAYLKTMKPARAAETLEESTADIGRIVLIFDCMKVAEAAAIMDKMDPLYVAKILQRKDDMASEGSENLLSEFIRNYLNQDEP